MSTQPNMPSGEAGWHGDAEEALPPSAKRRQPKPSTNSIRAPKEREAARIVFEPRPITDLGPSVPPEWVWPGYVAKGHITLFMGLWKAGKSTLLGHLLRDLQRGGGLVKEALRVKTLVITEESSLLWTARREALALGPDVHVACRPFRSFPSTNDWEELILRTVRYVRSEGIDFVIFDTISKLWPVFDENDAGKVIAAVMPLQDITDLGAAIMLVHHPRKGDAGEGQASRGSGALPGAADILLEFRRHTPNDSHDRRRRLTGYSRFDDTPSELVIELRDDGYHRLGDPRDAEEAARMSMITELLTNTNTPLTASEIRVAWPGNMVPSERTLDKDLKRGVENARWHRSGEGRKGDPYRFAVFDSRSPLPIGARIESGAGPRDIEPQSGGRTP